MANAPGEVTLLLAQVKTGDQAALGRLIPLVYKELAYLRLPGQDRADWQNRAQFMGVAAQPIRRILVDYAWQRAAAKRTPGAGDLELGATSDKTEEVLAVDEALGRLAALDAQQGRVVEMRYFGGLSVEETAEALVELCGGDVELRHEVEKLLAAQSGTLKIQRPVALKVLHER